MVSNAQGTNKTPKDVGVRTVRPVKPILRLAIAVALIIPMACATNNDEKGSSGSASKSTATVPGSVLFIPASAHVSGALGTNWRTDLEMYNPGQVQATVTVSLLEDRQNNSNPVQRTYTLDPGESLRYEDVLPTVFGFEGAAALMITNDVGMVAATSRTLPPSRW